MIESHYILITHNSVVPSPGKFIKYLDDPKLIVWFAQNVENCVHPKLKSIPLGLANRCWDHGSILELERSRNTKKDQERKNLLYVNINSTTNLAIRKPVFECFKNKEFVTLSCPKPFPQYLIDLKKSKFVLSPRGNGLDCHRTWEAMYLGAIPVVKSSDLDCLFEDLPVLIIEDWNEVTREYLEHKWEEMSKKTYNFEKLYFPYCENEIEKCRSDI